MFLSLDKKKQKTGKPNKVFVINLRAQKMNAKWRALTPEAIQKFKNVCVYFLMMKKVSFRIERIFFNEIVDGKPYELRSNIPHWRWLLGDDPPKVAVFVCGKDVHRRRITDIYLENPCKHPHTRRNVRTRDCIVIKLGDEVRT